MVVEIDITQVAQLLAALGVGGAVAQGLRALFNRKQMSADYADVISASAVRLIAPLEAQIAELRADNERKALRITQQEARITRLEGLILSLGGTLDA